MGNFNLIIPCGLPQGENKYVSLLKLDTLWLAAGRFICLEIVTFGVYDNAAFDSEVLMAE